MEEQLKKIREEIDAVDDQLLIIFNRRMKLIKEVGNLKRNHNGVIYRPEREQSILERLRNNNNGLLTPEAIESLFMEIFAVSRNYELPERVAFLGPEGSFTHQAAESRFGSLSNYVPLSNIETIFENVVTKRVKFGVIPIENNQEGSVTETIDLLGSTDVKIVAEMPMNIHFTFSSIEDKLTNIQRIYSKDIGFKQCKKFIQEFFGNNIELIPVSSTSKAAQIAKKEPHSAAICPQVAARIYDLPVLFANIEDSVNNTTRFLIISGDFDSQKSGNDKTTIIAKVEDKAGSLAELLQAFNEAKINLCKVDSRPLKYENQFQYWFLIDLEGHIQDENVKIILEKYKDQVKWLGSYVKLC
ncbi:MAG: prephenate dehydratase [Bacteroidetes bacterium]|nr:MAG: prephenate dehydratase [Bacteroidota bacterium]